jgi:lisH domain-containing protein FOPNL
LVSNALEDRTGVARPDISNENLILNELIREYLVFNR